MIKEHYIHKESKVYWAEYTNWGWKVLSGYYLRSYTTGFDTTHCNITHIVTKGDITSLVVKHLNTFFLTEKEAWASIADKEKQE